MNALFRGSIEQRVRLVTGLILFAFALTHFLNHAAGLYSIDAMQAVEHWRLAVTRSLPGGIVLGGALVIHILLALRKLAFRSTLRMPFWESAQLILGLAIPLLLIPHLVPMRLAYELFGADTTYLKTLLHVWQGRSWQQSLLLLFVWTHACIGLHFWLRLSKWYPKVFLPLFALAVAIPLAGLAGFMVSGRQQEAQAVSRSASSAAPRYGNDYGKSNSSSYGDYGKGGSVYDKPGNDYGYGTAKKKAARQARVIVKLVDTISYIFIGLLGLTAAVFTGRKAARRLAPRVEIQYADGPTIFAVPGPTLLEVSRMNNVPHASVCGGRGRCSTCRVRIEQGGEALGPRSSVEQITLASVNAGPHDRLACQIRPKANLGLIRVLRPASVNFSSGDFSGERARGEERDLAVLFIDVRGFTSMSAGKLPYDVVFILNQLFAVTGQAIQANGGWIDKYLGDGLMAVFGRECTAQNGCLQALRAAQAIDIALENLNKTIAEEAGGEIRIGMGLHMGPLVLGEIGHSGSAALTVIGRTVNAAARLEAMTKDKGCQLIVSSDVASCAGLDVKDRERESVDIRGLPEPLDVLCYSRARDLAV